ncbi:hypothetical protein M431DRAFT_510718 [Trichoderma harzianum CBS 226.95]|uniref:Uncharacterized protein n=1 Tax=Trichoderma harzianum CBS 226.95 TaxID=983964 RepID=A0A2T4A3B8_TRIHA|nr:hypothetical protein M431DRAFT_510718 [Trichoderma harzianum CBS 226.95]PTB51565.1 hypothetical protein M431DRAFT_510718 [Trichoderma harzianum CBS 226.95]
MPSQCDNRRKPLHAASLLSAAARPMLGCTTRKLSRFIGKTCPLYGVLVRLPVLLQLPHALRMLPSTVRHLPRSNCAD